MFPSFMLNKVYVQKSLKNAAGGFEFTLKNIIDTGTLGGVILLTVDGVAVQLPSIAVRVAGVERRADDINYRNSILVRMNAEIIVSVTGQPLAVGRHDIKLAVSILEAGKLELTIVDDVV